MLGSENKNNRRVFLTGASALVLAGCSGSQLPPVANKVVINKSTRQMEIHSKGGQSRLYRVNLGFTPRGHKRKYGDGRTPEGNYYIDRRNPRSSFHLSLGINYPNAHDIARAKELNIDPGNDIFIHGGPRLLANRNKADWTAGCIAVTNREIEEIWAMVPLGTPVKILA